jgi:carboxyl-terminal processing protease
LYTAYNLLQENFQAASSTAPAVSTDEHVWGAVQGLADSYGDPYTVFLPPQDKEIFESSVRGDFQGVGMEIGIRDDVLTVVAPLKDTPAERAGLRSGDKIFEIDGVSTAGVAVDAAVEKIRGEKGSTVSFTISRNDGDPFKVDVVRDTILLPTLETELRDDGVFVISLFSFNALAPQYFRDAIREFADSGSDKMILDLRGNPGGFLEVAVDIASWYLPVGKAIVIEDHNDDTQDQTLRSRGYDVFTDQLKFVILIDQGSASASEILAGALSAHDKAILIGDQSFGKGSVQQLFDVTSDSSIKITIARWLTPSGVSISHGGLTPDIKVELTDEDIENGYDRQLEKAVEYLISR